MTALEYHPHGSGLLRAICPSADSKHLPQILPFKVFSFSVKFCSPSNWKNTGLITLINGETLPLFGIYFNLDTTWLLSDWIFWTNHVLKHWKQHGNTEVSEAQLTGNRLFHLLSLLSPYFWLCDLQFSSLFFTLCWFCLFSNVRTHSKISHWIVLNILLLARIPNERKLFFVPLLSLFPTLSLSLLLPLYYKIKVI